MADNTDLREGLTPAARDALDMLEKRRDEWGQRLTLEKQLWLAADSTAAAARACRGRGSRQSAILTHKRRLAIEAAARLIDAADEIGRIIAEGEV